MNKAYISIGSNLSPQRNIRASISWLGKLFGTLEMSGVYKTLSQGFDGPDFLNLVIAAETGLSAEEIQQELLRIEEKLGRERHGPKFSDRVIDLDLLLLGSEVIYDDNLKIPRPEIEEYAHVLVPLNDLAAEEKHPLSGRRFRELRFDLQDRDPAQFSSMQEIDFPL